MATSSSASAPVGPETPITIKINVNNVQKKFKLPLADLTPAIMPAKLRALLCIPDGQTVVFERFSDSSATYVNLDPSNLHAYKTLFRAAKAKLKLRLRATLGPDNTQPIPQAFADTLISLANLNFGSETTLANIPVPSASNTVEKSPIESPESAAPQPPSITSDISTVAAAIAAASRSTPVASAVEPTMPAVEQKPEPSCPPMRDARDSEQLVNMLRACQLKRARQEQRAQGGCTRRSYPAYMPCNAPVMRMSHPPTLPAGATYTWSVYCNECNKHMLDEHFHCNICENGDYDLCVDCMNKGKHCLDESHWLIKRFLRSGQVVNSTTETVASQTKVEAPQGMPGAFTEEKKAEELEKPTRTCNCCVKVFDEDAFVTCIECEDYDVCVPCLEDGKHGHHPGHHFKPATSFTILSSTARALCNAGRNVQHAAICDECNQRIVGVRHKCLVCPDWDYCSTCVRKAPIIHRGHRFAPVYDLIPAQHLLYSPLHIGVYCDGPLCKTKKTCIGGVRYKCAVCPDIDFCASCEAHPQLDHNRTHPLLKFRSPVRECSITTVVGEERARPAPAESSSTTHIRTVAEVKPTETPVKSTKEKIEIKDLLAEPVQEKTPLIPVPVEEKSHREVKSTELQAYFIRDTISDGTTFPPEKTFTQVWTLKNPGPHVWPAGCSVRYVGGDNMLNVDDSRPSSDSDVSKATESNVIRRPVQVNEEISFRVLMKAPKREGVAISYWRLKAADGTPFGHRLWCHINVSGPSPTPAIAKDTFRELGRLGNHDNFLRNALNEQAARNAGQAEGLETTRNALTKTENAKYQAQQDRRRHIEQLVLTKIQDASTRSSPPSPSGAALSPRAVSDAKGKSPVPSESSVKSSPIVKTQTVEVVEELAPRTSKMVFPKLEKESPASSIVTNSAAPESVPAVASAQSEDAELFDDAESISVVEESDDSDSGFLTEEEYDILDASDEDTA